MEGKHRKSKLDFNYENKVWGAPEVKISPFYIQALKLKYTLEALRSIKGKVLDMGCGGGNLAKAIKRYRPDLKVYGIDISKNAITIAKKNSQGVEFRTASCEDAPFEKDSFDAIVMYDVLEHMSEPQKTINEMKRILKKKGVIHIFSPLDGQEGTFYYLIYKIGWQPKNEHTGHLQVFSAKSFEYLLKKSGFEIMNKKFSFHYLFSIFDIGYFSLLQIAKFKPTGSIESMIADKKTSLKVKIFNFIYRIVIALGYYESLIFSDIPAGGGHYTIRIRK